MVLAYDGRYLVEPFRRWQPVERRAMRFVRGRVLDLGCGAGRVCLHLQERGLDVVGIDTSPGAIEACRRRGVRDARLLALAEVDARLGSSTRCSCSETTSGSWAQSGPRGGRFAACTP